MTPGWSAAARSTSRRVGALTATGAALIALGFRAPSAHAQEPQGPAIADSGVPADLRPMLTPHHSEMRLVVTRYGEDRALLSSNYAGNVVQRGRRRGRGAQPDTTIVPPLPLSIARTARLRRFDLAWQQALAHVDSNGLTAEARPELDSLRHAVDSNLVQLDTDAVVIGRFAAVLPFAHPLVDLVEARLQLRDVDAEQAAGVLTSAAASVTNAAALLGEGVIGPGGDVVRLDHEDALRVAETTDLLRRDLAAWFGFYDGFDPLFTWWIPRPYAHLDAALAQYAAVVRDTVATSPDMATHSPPPDEAERFAASLAAAPSPGDIGDVPDLAAMLALPQDEMTTIVARFRGIDATRGYGGPANAAPVVRDSSYYQAWLAALQTLDFDHLTRNAQVDYLYLRHMAELQLARIGHPLPEHPPRVADSSGLAGDARGREGLIRDLQDELIPYTPEQLITLAEREFAWCQQEMLKASRQMGFGEDWKAALEKTKTMHVEPGAQPAMIRDLVEHAIAYVRAHDLVTVPEAAAESQHMSMLTMQQQLVNPFFLGGPRIQVAFPTDSMEYDARLQSMRGNNMPWSHATAFHEMIPGHNLSQYYQARYAGYRADLGASTPFYTEGWAVYWELTLYNKGFDTTPEERVGALFWRMFRCARIIFSLKFHMGEWSPQQAVNFLVDSVGHEQDNATAEVRRSIQGNYSPLYQAGYLLGALQLRALRHEFVDSQQLTENAFHDAILRQGSMPIGLIRLALSRKPLTRDMDIEWKFYGDLPAQ